MCDSTLSDETNIAPTAEVPTTVTWYWRWYLVKITKIWSPQ